MPRGTIWLDGKRPMICDQITGMILIPRQNAEMDRGDWNLHRRFRFIILDSLFCFPCILRVIGNLT
jgi:hypothetical protein